MGTTVTDQQLDALGDILLRQGHCDQRTLDRARRVAVESDQRLDAVLIQLGPGLGTWPGRRLCQSAVGAGYPADRYPPSEPVLPDRLSAAFPAPRAGDSAGSR